MNSLKYLEKFADAKAIQLLVTKGILKGSYYTSISSFDTKSISIVAPSKKGNTIMLSKGTEVEISLSDNTYTYTFTTIINGRSLNPTQLYILDMPQEIIKFSKRNFVRVEVRMKMFYQEASQEEENNHWKIGNTLDISGGGLLFTTKEELMEEKLLNIKIPLPEKEIMVYARICKIVHNTEKKQYYVSLEYINLSERERDIIIRYVYSIQRNMLKKGLT